MPITRSLARATPLVLVAIVCSGPVRGEAPVPGGQPPETSKSASAPVEVEIKYIDDSTMKLKLLDPQLELVTKYGTLQIPTADVRKIDFSSRTPPEVGERINQAIGNLSHPDFQVREQATAELKGYRERAFTPLLRATKSPDPEVSRRADEAVRYIQTRVPAATLEGRDVDVVHTDDSKLTGRLTCTHLRITTFQFGEQQLRVADIRSLRSGSGLVAEELVSSGPAPANLMTYQNQYGKEMTFTVTGAQPGSQGTGIWGTDVYTLDSSLAAAAVHSGLVQPGQTGVVRVRIVTSPPQFIGSNRNGMGSSGYGNYPAGAYEFVRK
jgi:hypothetical protein